MKRLFNLFLCFSLLILFFTSVAVAEEKQTKVFGQQIYVPIYSHIIIGTGLKMDLSATISIRNTSFDSPITLEKVTYYDSNGKLVREEIKNAMVIPPMGSKYFTIGVNDTVGGVGANYIVSWNSDKAVTAPVVESVMFGSVGATGLSFSRNARVLKEKIN